jgi:signal transduction histidine kinase
VEVLRQGAARLGAGELHYRLDVQTGDELQALADAFNQMAAQLHASYTDLEATVAARTWDLERANQHLAIANQHKSQFLATMSHELRTPLHAILGYTHLILDRIYGEIPPRVADKLQRVHQSGQHLLTLINAVLDLARIESGRLALSLTAYTMADVVSTVVTTVEPLAAAKQLRLTVTLPADLPPGTGDAPRLTQVLFNLVGNAIAFTDAGEVGIDVSAADDTFTVAVRDTGPGIAAADQQRIFAAFEQVDTASARTHNGTGLGLAIAKQIIELHGGRIGVRSCPGQGATFWFTVPRRVTRPEEAA